MTVDPTSTRLKLPVAYGAPVDSPLMAWSAVVERLEMAERYWLATVNQNAAPIARPLDGVWLEGSFYFGGDPATRWRRNLARNPQACLSIDDTTNPVILEGSVSIMPMETELASNVAGATRTKYGWGSVDQFRTESCVFRPFRCIAWIGLFQNATSFRFDE